MPLSLQEVERIARLARLELTPAQKKRYRAQLDTVLAHMAKLGEVDTSEVPPTASVSKPAMPLRPDVPGASLGTDELLGAAPQQQGGQFKIPPVFD